jgi:hypothetical protein
MDEEAIKVAKSCLDYCGGYARDADDGKYRAFQHGIKTVITALERRKAWDDGCKTHPEDCTPNDRVERLPTREGGSK